MGHLLILPLFSFLPVILLLIASANAQTTNINEVWHVGEIYDDLGGYTPKSLESLVGASAIILKGRFGDFLSNELSFGYGGDTRESLKASRGLSDAELDSMGVPASKYEVILDEVLLGDIKKDVIAYSIFELPPTDRRFTHPAISRLFFLSENPDGTYSPMGPASVLNMREGQYSYDSLTTFKGVVENQMLEFMPDMRAEAFEEKLRDVIVEEKIKRQ